MEIQKALSIPLTKSQLKRSINSSFTHHLGDLHLIEAVSRNSSRNFTFQNGFSIVDRNRDEGGVLLYIKEDIPCKELRTA